METFPARDHTMFRGCEHHSVDFLIQYRIMMLQYPGYGRKWGVDGEKVHRFRFPNIPKGLQQTGLPYICPRQFHAWRSGRDTQIGTNRKGSSIPWPLPIP